MTDDEIDAILIPELARYLECEHGDLPVTECERNAYRAGMLRAARIARELEDALWAEETPVPNVSYAAGLSAGAGDVAAAIERAASDEQKGGAA